MLCNISYAVILFWCIRLLLTASLCLGWSALHYASAGGHTGVVADLLAHGAQVQPDCQGRLPLHLAALSGESRTIAALLHRSRAEVPPHFTHSSWLTSSQFFSPELLYSSELKILLFHMPLHSPVAMHAIAGGCLSEH